MKIGLVDVDSHNFPNLCLMKLSEYHTRRGDWVEWWNPKGRYDLVYKSRVFTDTYSKDTIEVNNAEQVIQGGTGYGPGGKDLPYEIEHIRLTNPDNIALLNKVRTKAVHFAWDNPEEDLTEHFRRFVAHTAIRSDRNRRVYVLTNYGSTHEQDLYRVNTLRALGYDPYVMIYERPTAPKITRHLQRWVNNKRIFHTVKDFRDYAPMKKEVH